MDVRAYQTLLVSVTDGVVTVMLNKPERKNPIGPAMVNELCWALDDAKDDDDVRVIVLTGAGAAFSAGGDLAMMAGSAEGPPPLAFRGDYADLLMRFAHLGKPTIARVPGVAMGGGLGLVASCDFAVACESAIIGTPEIKRGLFPMQIMAVLMRVVPRRKLVEMMLLGDKLTAKQAMEYGLLSHVVPDAELDRAVSALAARLVALSPMALRMGLTAFHHQADQELATALPYLRGELIKVLGTEDAREGLVAFMEKREPKWTGR